MEDENILPDRSFAYRKGKSTSMCLNEVFQIANLNLNQGVMLSLDVDAAYESVQLDILCRKLVNGNAPLNEVNWTMNFPKERKLVLDGEEVTAF